MSKQHTRPPNTGAETTSGSRMLAGAHSTSGPIKNDHLRQAKPMNADRRAANLQAIEWHGRDLLAEIAELQHPNRLEMEMNSTNKLSALEARVTILESALEELVTEHDARAADLPDYYIQRDTGGIAFARLLLTGIYTK